MTSQGFVGILATKTNDSARPEIPVGGAEWGVRWN